jgi:hypothetical protein
LDSILQGTRVEPLRLAKEHRPAGLADVLVAIPMQ